MVLELQIVLVDNHLNRPLVLVKAGRIGGLEAQMLPKGLQDYRSPVAALLLNPDVELFQQG